MKDRKRGRILTRERLAHASHESGEGSRQLVHVRVRVKEEANDHVERQKRRGKGAEAAPSKTSRERENCGLTDD